MIRVAVVDDEAKEQELLRGYFDRISKALKENFCVELFSSGDEFLASFSCSYDIICLDIEMPGKNGIDTAAAIREKDKNVLLLFVTNMAQMAIRGYEVQAWDFLLKPINEYSFAMKIKNVVQSLKSKRCRVITVQTPEGLERFTTNDLLYVEVQGHYIYYHTTSGNLRQKGALKELETALAELPFSKCNQCYLVNLNWVSSVRKDNVKVGEDWLRISRPRKKLFLDALSRHLGGMTQRL